MIYSEEVKVNSRSGFGFIIYNKYTFAGVLYKMSEAIESYIREKVREYDRPIFNRVIKHLPNIMFCDVNSAILSFIRENIDLYGSYN